MTEQHFLTNPRKLEHLVKAARIKPQHKVMELGSGAGTVAAALPPCELHLVELDPVLAKNLAVQFKGKAAVSCVDALVALQTFSCDILLANLPHALSRDLFKALREVPQVKRAVIALHMDFDSKAVRALLGKDWRVEDVCILDEEDFSPAQPFKSRVVELRRNTFP